MDETKAASAKTKGKGLQKKGRQNRVEYSRLTF
jgi:hypothetical protein